MTNKIHYTLALTAAIAALAAVSAIGLGHPQSGQSDNLLVACPTDLLEKDPLPAGGPDVIFTQDHVRTYTLCLPPEDLQHLQEHAFDKEYQAAILFIDGHKIGQVGIRYKGHDSLRRCFDHGVQTCSKAGMRVQFDEFKPGFTLNGLANLNFHGMPGDVSLMREHVSYYLFRSMGVPAPRTAYARLAINGQDLGLFTLVEQIDGKFIKEHFPGTTVGNLYKEAWPTAANAEQALEQLRTNRRAADLTTFLNFNQELLYTNEDGWPEVLDQYLNVDEALRYLAVDRVIDNQDSIISFYCEEDYCGNHNFYVYEDRTGKFWLIPWDAGDIFGAATYTESVPEWNAAPGDCNKRYGDRNLQAPNCDLLLHALAVTEQAAYQKILTELASGPLRTQEIYPYIDKLAELVAPEVATDPLGPSSAYWQNAILALKDEVKISSFRIAALQDQTLASTARLSPTALNSWEKASTSSIVLDLKHTSSPSTSFTHRPNRVGPLSGTKDLRLDFTFRNGQDAWSQWGSVKMPFTSREVSLQGQGIQLLLRSDKPREVRIGLESDAYTHRDEGIAYGWNVEVGLEPTPVTLNFADLATQHWAIPVPETKEDVLARVTALSIEPFAEGVDGTTGLFPPGVSDTGHLQIDDISFIR